MKLETLKLLQEATIEKGLVKFGVIITGAQGGRLKYNDIGLMVFTNEADLSKASLKMFNEQYGTSYIDEDQMLDDQNYDDFCEYVWFIDRF